MEIKNLLHAKRVFKIQIEESEKETIKQEQEQANEDLSLMLSLKPKHKKIKEDILKEVFKEWNIKVLK